jgi:hypothetical protein
VKKPTKEEEKVRVGHASLNYTYTKKKKKERNYSCG